MEKVSDKILTIGQLLKKSKDLINLDKTSSIELVKNPPPNPVSITFPSVLPTFFLTLNITTLCVTIEVVSYIFWRNIEKHHQ